MWFGGVWWWGGDCKGQTRCREGLDDGIPTVLEGLNSLSQLLILFLPSQLLLALLRKLLL